ncbi:DUF6884 domain-containing protein, partial [Nonomuraea rubra]|uniref:DUF6884 domain-containing protein n=1 Tax=Nonomuraea rubra TaxID=46180 RepID=UPI003403C885
MTDVATEYRTRENAIALQWTRAIGEVMHKAVELGLHVDDRGYHVMSQAQGRGRRPALRSKRGRQVARARVELLIAAGFLTVEGTRVQVTNDGWDAYAAWSRNVDTSVEVELDELPPLRGGEEATRRHAAYEARIAEWQARLAEWATANDEIMARAEAAEAERIAKRDADRAARRYSSAADAIHTPDEVLSADELDANRGAVVTLTGDAAEVAEQARPVVIVPCGGRKLDTDVAVPAGELYTGSYHRAARRAAEALAGRRGRVLILSALHGLVALDEPLLPYELRAGQPGTVTGERLREQAAALGITDAAVTVLGGRAYTDLARQVWPAAAAPLQGCRGIGEQLARLAAIYNAPQPAELGPIAARRAALDAARRARYVTAGALTVDGGRAAVRFTFPAAAGKDAARLAAAVRFAAAYGVTTAAAGARELDATGTPEQVARLVSALPRLLDLAEGYTSLAVKQLGRWERHSSAAAHLAGVAEAELRALRRTFRAEAFEAVVDALLTAEGDVEVAAPDEAAPMWAQAAAVAGAIAEYGWVDVAERADAVEVAELLAAAAAAPVEAPIEAPVELAAAAPLQPRRVAELVDLAAAAAAAAGPPPRRAGAGGGARRGAGAPGR